MYLNLLKKMWQKSLVNKISFLDENYGTLPSSTEVRYFKTRFISSTAAKRMCFSLC